MCIKKTILSIMITAVTFALLSMLSVFTLDLKADAMPAMPRDVIKEKYYDNKASGPIEFGWYFWVTIEDVTDGTHRSCDNSEGYIVLQTYNGEWYAKMPAKIMDEKNVKWTFGFGENKRIKSDYDFSNSFFKAENNEQLVGSFPYALKLIKTKDPNSVDYMVNNNQTWTSHWKITLYCMGDTTKKAIKVCSWDENCVSSTLGGSWSDVKQIPEENRAKVWKIANLEGPDEITRPDLGGVDVTAYYTIDTYDQYGAKWLKYLAGPSGIEWTTNSDFVGYYGCSIQITGHGPLSKFYTGELTVTQYQLEITAQGGRIPGDIDTFVRVKGPDGTVLEKNVKLLWPKHKVTFKDGDGNIFEGPNTVYSLSFVEYPKNVPTKTPVMDKHYVFVKQSAYDSGWWSNDTDDYRIRKDSVFYPYFEAREHSYTYDETNRNHKCSVCGYVASLSHKLAGNGTESNPWIIKDINDWKYVAKYLKLCGSIPENAYFVLAGDINGVDYDSAIGDIIFRSFSGVLDGCGHKITLNCNTNDDNKCFAPFMCIKDATIRNVSIEGNALCGTCAGMAVKAEGTNLIENCTVSADIKSSQSGCAGFIKDGYKSNTTIKGCIFSGILNFRNNKNQGAVVFFGGSQYNPTPVIINCLDLSNNSYPLVTTPVSSEGSTVDNSYFVKAKSGGWKNGGKLACDLRSANGIELTLCGNTGIQYNDRIYVAKGENFAFTAKKNGEMIKELLFASDDGKWQYISSDDNGIFTLTADNGVLSDDEPSLSLKGSGTEQLPYIIETVDDWNELSDYVSNGGKTAGLYFLLANDISVNTMIGSGNPFLGSFDGAGHTLTVTFDGSQYASPFCNAGCAGNEMFIRNLCVRGIVRASEKNAAGIIGRAEGKIEITGCVSGVSIISAVNGEGAHGGLIGTIESGSIVVIKGCAFTGKLLTSSATDSCAGFAGLNNGDLTIMDSIYAPQDIGEGEKAVLHAGSSTFFRGDNGDVSGCFYTVAFGSAQGSRKLSIRSADGYVTVNVTKPAGAALREYDVSRIKVYPSMTVFGDECYYGSGDEVDITLAHSDRNGFVFKGYKIGNDVLVGTDPLYVITMPDSDIAISSDWIEDKKPDPVVVQVMIDKKTANVVCGRSMALKADLKGTASKISWKSSDTKIATVDSNGKVTTKKAGQVTITATAAGKSAKCTVTVLYKDVIDSSEFWYAPTNYLTAKNVVKGYADQTEFRPANDCTRAQMVTFLYRLQGEPKTKAASCQFTDVKSTDYFYKPVIWAVENGITTGVSAKKFDPQGVCTRAQTVTFLWRMAGKPEPAKNAKKFDDVKSTDYFYKATLWASGKKILAGYDDGTFKPQGKCLRRQMVTFLYKYDKFVNGKG